MTLHDLAIAALVTPPTLIVAYFAATSFDGLLERFGVDHGRT